MRSIYASVTLILLAIFLSLSSLTFAAESDTLVVYASGANLDDVISGDVTSSGDQAHSVYKLVSRDTTYLYYSTITVQSDITIIGELGDDGRPPCIQPGLLSDNSLPTVFLNMTGEGTVGTFKNFYFLGLSIDGSYTGSKDFLVSADGIKFYMDNVIIDENHYEVVAFNAKECSFFITNCKFRNSVHPTNWFGSSLLACDYPSNNPADTIVMKYNTFLGVNSRAATTGNDNVVNYFEFSHNSYVYNVTEDLRMFTVAEGKFNHNIFYGLYAGAQPVSEYPSWFQVFSADTNSLIDFDTLTVAMDSTFAPEYAGESNWRMLAEGKRDIEVLDNIYFWPEGLTDFWDDWNSTHTGDDYLYLPLWMNNRTQNMFDDDENWPYLDESGNKNVDPEFGASIRAVLDNSEGTDGVVGLLDYVTGIRSGTASTNVWGYRPQTVSGDYWIPEWPLPEETTGDLKYSAALTATDGKPYGDPYWFTLSTNSDELSTISNGKSYTASLTPSDYYPDANGTKLTNGNFASTAYYADAAWVGYSSSGTLEVVIDLGEAVEVEQFMGEYLLDPQPAIYLPDSVTVSISTDNSSFTELGIMSDNSKNDTSSSIHKYYYTLSSPVTARYVKFTTSTPSDAWIFVDEYQVLSSDASITGVEDETDSSIPTKFELSNNYPNPFNPTTRIKFSLPESGMVTLKVYNILGQEVRTLVNREMSAGSYDVNFNASNLASGVYIYSISAGAYHATKKMMLLK